MREREREKKEGGGGGERRREEEEEGPETRYTQGLTLVAYIF
jgi:hypothetical protein